MKLHRVVVVASQDWEARQTPRSEDIYGGELKAWYLVNVENQLEMAVHLIRIENTRF